MLNFFIKFPKYKHKFNFSYLPKVNLIKILIFKFSKFSVKFIPNQKIFGAVNLTLKQVMCVLSTLHARPFVYSYSMQVNCHLCDFSRRFHAYVQMSRYDNLFFQKGNC